MRRFCLIAWLSVASAAGAATMDHAGTYIGWGGEGGQVFRHKVSLLKNNPNSERNLLLIVDDLPRRGPRFGIARVTVEYTGGEGVSKDLLKRIHAKPYPYVLVRMYEVPQSPRIARLVMPTAAGMKATFRFHHTVQRGITGENAKAMAADLTRTIDLDTLRELPVINPLRDPSVRKPRRGQEDAAPLAELRAIEEATPVLPPDETAAAPVPSPSASAPALPSWLPPPPGQELPLSKGAAPITVPVTPAPIDENDPRVEATRQWARRVAEEIREKKEAQARGQRPAAPEGPGIAVDGAPSDRMGLDYEEDTPEMVEAQRRAARLESAVVIQPSDSAVQ